MFLSQLLRSLNDAWRSPTRARVLYLTMTLAFAGLAVAAALLADAAVAAVAAVIAIVTLTLALIAPRLARLTGPPPTDNELGTIERR